MADNTLREFLVTIGWKVNGSEQQTFVNALEAATLRANLLADAIEAVAVKAANMVASVITSFDRLYYLSERTNASVATLKDYGFAIQNLGGSAEQARSSLEGLAEKLRFNPQYIGWVNQLGFGLNKTTGQLEAQKDLMLNLGKMSWANAEMIADKVGFDHRTLFVQWKHAQELAQQMDAAAASRKKFGLEDPEKAAGDAKTFMQEFRKLWLDIGNISDGGLTKLINGLTPILRDFDTYLNSHSEEIKTAVTNIVKAIVDFLEMLEKAVKDINWKEVNKRLSEFGKSASDLTTALGGLQTVLEIFFGLWLTSKAVAALKVISSLAGFLTTIGGFAASLAMLQMYGDTSYRLPIRPGQETPEQLRSEAERSGQTESWGDWGARKWRTRPKFLGGTGGGADSTSEAGSLTALINEAAAKEGIDPRIMQGIRAGESGRTSKYDVKDDAMESSWGPFQLNRRRGLGVEFERDTGLDVRDPNTIPAQAAWVAKYIREHNGTNGQWMGYRGPRDAEPGWGNSGYVPTPSATPTGAATPGGPVVFGDSIGAGVKDALRAQGAAVVGMGSDWITSQIKRFGGDLRGRKIILSSGASNSRDPKALSGQIAALVAKGVNPKDITVLGVGDRGDFAGYNETLKSIAEGAGASFTPIGETAGDHVHPNDYGRVAHDAMAAGAASSSTEKPWWGSPMWKGPLQGRSPWGSLTNPLSNPLGGSGAGDVTHINAPQHTEIHIDGTGDPTAVAHMVGANQNAVAANMARNLQGATG